MHSNSQTKPHQMRIRHSHAFLSTTGATAASLSPSDLTSISTLLPRLITSGQLPVASRLLSASLLLPPPHPSFHPLSSLLSSLPDLAPTFSLLNSVRYHPLKPSPLPLFPPLLSSFLASRSHKDSSKVFFWLCRPDSAHRPDENLYHLAVRGFCKLERMLEVLRVMREMASDEVVVGEEVRGLVYTGLLQEARVDEAKELDLVFRSLEEDRSGDGFEKASKLLDRLISEWEDR
ncbi:hypothetical protein LUZ61_002219 [Rhynchospora tenuis]|uniref:Pentatricopeptide repeat-containing protein n=1 Tax=Rhynchospora tenuis TaxID=198213 RepID=A0AAD6ERK7_9POAL|nr:hypothetical protein LUZ61_002219 [Rhynchospora tenuis]